VYDCLTDMAGVLLLLLAGLFLPGVSHSLVVYTNVSKKWSGSFKALRDLAPD
jgi:hypothetical protein